MASPDEPKGAQAPDTEAPSPLEQHPIEQHYPTEPAVHSGEPSSVAYEQVTDNSNTYNYYEDSYNYGAPSYPSAIGQQAGSATLPVPPLPALPAPSGSKGGGSGKPPSPPDDDEEDEGMLRMSFMEHLEELRKRILYMLAGVGIAFVVSLTFSNELWLFVSAPAVDALKELGVKQQNLVQISPMDVFNIIWMKLPILSAIFIGSPWILYQVWAFIAPGLYKKERRWAAPFVISSAGLFILGGVFAYFVAFRYGLKFLLGLGLPGHIVPMVSVTDYFDLFVNVMLGVGLVFEMPILIFFLTLLHLVTPKFLIAHSRYAILAIVIIAAIVTPTPDVFNLMLFAVPMCLLFYVGIFASYILVLQREKRRFPWSPVLKVAGLVLVVIAGVIYLLIARFGFHILSHWPFLTR